VTDPNIIPGTFGEWGVKFSLLGEEQLTKARRREEEGHRRHQFECVFPPFLQSSTNAKSFWNYYCPFVLKSILAS
jgi:hypothetical protein